MTAFARRLARLGADDYMINWASAYADMPRAWAACERGDWMLWIALRVAAALPDEPLDAGEAAS